MEKWACGQRTIYRLGSNRPKAWMLEYAFSIVVLLCR